MDGLSSDWCDMRDVQFQMISTEMKNLCKRSKPNQTAA